MITRKLPVKLTREEVRLRGKRMAVLESEIETLELEKKDMTSDFKSKIEVRKTEISKLSREINEEREYRQVEIIEQKDWELREVLTTRTDTGEVVDARPMSPQEMQRPIPFNQVKIAEEHAGQVLDSVADEINAGALGPDVTASRKRA